MIGTIAAEIAALQERVEYFTAQVAAAEEGTPAYMELSKELQNVKDKLTAKQTEQASIEQAGTVAGEAIVSDSENIVVTVGDRTAIFSIRDLARDEGYYDILMDWVKAKFSEVAQNNAAIVNSYVSENEALKARVKELEDDAYRADRNAADLEAKLANAAVQIEEGKEEIARKDKEISELREKLSKSNVTIETNLNGSMAEKIMKKHMELPAVYNKRDIEGDNKNWLANLAETGEEVLWPKIYPGRYREVSAEEAAMFRTAGNGNSVEQAGNEEAAATAPAVEAPVQSGMGVTPPAVPFPPVPGAVNGVANSELTGEVEAAAVTGDGEGAVTRAEFEYMKVRMDSLEFRLRQVEKSPKDDWGVYNA